MAPRKPDNTNADRQPNFSAMSGMATAAMAAPTLDLLSKMATATLRSLAGNHSATTLLAPGQFIPSPTPSSARQNMNECSEFAAPDRMLAIDHQMTASARPSRA